VGFLPASDPRIRGTIAAVERELLQDGFVLRYRTREGGVDGLPAGEGVFLPCSFWLANCDELLGRHKDALELFERLVGLANDLGLLSEEYDPESKRLLGNFPQAFTHLTLVGTAFNVAPNLPSPMHLRFARRLPPEEARQVFIPVNFALTVRAAFALTLHLGFLPEQAPAHPVK